MARKTLMRALAPVMLAVLACCGSASFASSNEPLEGERLSDWMLRQAPSDQSFSLGLSWQVPSERVAQLKLQSDVLMQLVNAQQSANSLSNLIRALPITGRVRTPVPDARWLQAHPKYDPVLIADQQLTLPQRPTTVAVLTSEGVHCVLPHQAGAHARDYLNACTASATGLMSAYARAWVIQPDGLVMNYGIASWNEEAQAEVAPGGIAWADAAEVNRPSKLSQTITAFLATQTYDTVLSVAEPLRAKSVATVARTSQAKNLSLTANDWGMVGLMQTPSARMSPEGEARFNMSRVYPY